MPVKSSNYCQQSAWVHEPSPPPLHWAFLCHTAKSGSVCLMMTDGLLFYQNVRRKIWCAAPQQTGCERLEEVRLHLGNNLWESTTRKHCHHRCRIQSAFWICDMLHLLHMKGFNKESSNTDERCWKCTKSNCTCHSVFMKAITNPSLFLWPHCWTSNDEMYSKWRRDANPIVTT